METIKYIEEEKKQRKLLSERVEKVFYLLLNTPYGCRFWESTVTVWDCTFGSRDGIKRSGSGATIASLANEKALIAIDELNTYEEFCELFCIKRKRGEGILEPCTVY